MQIFSELIEHILKFFLKYAKSIGINFITAMASIDFQHRKLA